jgi:hypothetical protein
MYYRIHYKPIVFNLNFYCMKKNYLLLLCLLLLARHTTIAQCSGQNLAIVVAVISYTACPGGSCTYTASGANSYSWSNGATGSIVVVSPSVSTTYTVVGMNGSCTGSAVVSVVVPSPTLTISSAHYIICSGYTLSLNASGASNYTWSTGEQSVTISVSPSVTTTYTVSGTDNSHACAGTQSITITTQPNFLYLLLSRSKDTICPGASCVLQVTVGANSFIWENVPGGWMNEQVTVSPTITTVYYAAGTGGVDGSDSGCIVTQSIAVVVAACTGIDEQSLPDRQLIVFPNPVSEKLIVSSGAVIETLLIKDLYGRVVLEQQMDSAIRKKELDLSGISQGIYFLQSGKQQSIKLIKN